MLSPTRSLVAAVALLTAGTGLAACTAQIDRDYPADSVIRVALQEPPQALLPADVDDPDGAQVLATLFAPLVEFDSAGHPQPLAAESIEPDPDHRVWTVTLREGAAFHDGEPVTAANYLNAWNFAAALPNRQRHSHLFARIEGYHELNPPDGSPPTISTLSGLDRLDDRTFTVTLTEPFGELPALLGASAFYPLPQAAFAQPGVLREEFGQAPVGNGPYRLVGQRQPGEPFRLERHDSYPGALPRFAQLELVTYPDLADAYPDLLAGRVDVLTRIPPEHLAAASDLGDRLQQLPSPVFQYLALPAHQADLADPEVRLAISLAIDRDGFGPGRVAARSFVPPVVPGARADSCGTACRLDPAAARDLYRRAGGPDPLTLTYNADGDHAGWVDTVCDQLSAHLGVTCTAVAQPDLADLLVGVAGEEEVGLLRQGWTLEYPSMGSYLGPVGGTAGSANFTGYHNAEFDALVATGAAMGSSAEAVAAYQQAEDLLARDLPLIPVWFGQQLVGLSPRISQVTATPFGHLDLTG